MFGGESSIMSYGGGDNYDCMNWESAGRITLALLILYLVVFVILDMDSDRKSPVRVKLLDEQLDKIKK